MAISRDELVKGLTHAAFGEPLVSNMYRGLVAEAIVKSALSGQWTWCSQDWAAWDFEHEDGCKLEVKQSAALQTWSKGKASKCTFGIAASKGYFLGDVWKEEKGRKASIYVFAHHDGIDPLKADHLDPLQWRFCVIPEKNLPSGQKSVGLSMLTQCSKRFWADIDLSHELSCDVAALSDTVELIRSRLHAIPK